LLVVSAIAIQSKPVQNFIVHKTTSYIAKRLGVVVNIEEVNISFFDRLSLKGLYMQDGYKDTLAYVGELDVKLNDFFFLKDKIILKELKLNNAIVNLARPNNSDVWNYQFIIDSFATQQSKEQKDGTFPNIQLQRISLVNTKFNFIDKWVGTDYYFSTYTTVIEGDAIDYTNNKISIKSLEGDSVLVGILEYTGGRPPRKRTVAAPVIDTTPFNINNWTVSVANLKIANSRFFLEYPEYPRYPNVFSELHLDISKINTSIDNILIVGDTITGNVTNLTATDQCGLAIQQFKSKVKVSPNISECKQLYLRTNNSEIKDYYAMHYERFPDFLDYISKVKMVGHFKNSKVGINDILYFTDAIERIRNHAFILDAYGEGTVAHLMAKNITLSDGVNTFKGDFSIAGIPETEKIYMSVKEGNIVGTGKSALKYLPEFENSKYINLAALGLFNINCNFDGLVDDFSSNLDIMSNIGNVNAKLHIKNAASGVVDYNSDITLKNFHLGLLLNQLDLGEISSEASINGEGLDEYASHFAFDVKIPNISFKQYEYSNISLKGSYEDMTFSGSAQSLDTNLKIDISNGQINFEDNNTKYTLDAKLYYINTQALNWTDHDLHGNADINLNFSGTTLDNFLGSIMFYNMNVAVGDTALRLKQFYLNALNNGQETKSFNFMTNGLDAYLNGNVNISSLLPSFENYMHQFFPDYFKINALNDNFIQNFNFTINARKVDDVFKFINLPVRLSAGTKIVGNFNSVENLLKLDGTIPFISIGNFSFMNGNMQLLGDKMKLVQQLDVETFSYKDYEIASALKLTSVFGENNAQFSLTTESNNALGNAEISGNIITNHDSLLVHFNPSSILFNHKKWDVYTQQPIKLTQDNIGIPFIKLLSNQQIIHINENGYLNNKLNIDLHNVALNPINNLFKLTIATLDGKINGSLNINDIYSNPNIDYKLNVDTLQVDEIVYGKLFLDGNWDLNKSTIEIHPNSLLNSELGNASITIKAKYGDDHPYLKGNVHFDKIPIKWMEPFIKEYVYDLDGSFSSNIKLTGTLDKPIYNGVLNIYNAKVTPYVTQVPYFIHNQKIDFTQSFIEIRNMEIKDQFNNTGHLNGTVIYDGWDDYYFNLHLNSNNIQVLNLKREDNGLYYGNIHAKTDIDLIGPVDNIKMNVAGKPLAGSQLYILISSEGDYTQKDFISFKKTNDTKTIKPTKTSRSFDYNLKIDAIATPDLEAFIVLDETTGDIIQAKGNGNITMEIPSNDEISLNGNFVIEEGAYNFAFKQLEVFNLKKKFILEQGSTISWDGNLYDADLNVKANAQVRARLYELITNETDRISFSQQELSDAQLAQPINIHLDMEGALSSPSLSFRLDVVENRSIGSYAYQKLQRINSSERELLNQVAGLLILNQFLPSEGINNSNISTGTITNMSEIISSTASSQISNLANKIIGSDDLFINVRYKNYALSGYDPNNPTAYMHRNEAGLNVRKNFFNNRLVTEVGGVYDWGNSNSNYNLAGEFKLQYLVTKDGRIRLNVFRSSNYDAIFQQNVSRQGAGILYKKSFSNINELFTNKKRASFVDTTKNADTLK
jgi:hypothetical protein